MASLPHGNGAPFGGRLNALGRAWALVVDGMSALGTVLILVLMGVICSDVVVRNVFGGSLPVVAEFSALTLVMIVYLQLAAAIRHDRLARADIVLGALRAHAPRIEAVLRAVFDLVGAALLALLAWSTLSIFEADMARGRYIGVTGVLTVPFWPFRLVILIALGVATVQFAVQLATAVLRPARREGA